MKFPFDELNMCDAEHVGWVQSQMEAMCRRAATVGFTNDSLGLHPGFEALRQACLDLINRGQVVEGIAIPHAILVAPFPPEQKLRYFIDDGSVLDYNPGPFLVRDRPNQKDGA